MAISRDKKKDVIDAVRDIVASSKCVAFVTFRGLSVGDTHEMRSELREKDVGYRVAKKTLSRRALADADVSGDLPELEGELAFAYSGDILSAAQEIYAQQQKRDEAVAIIGGIFDGEYKNKEEMLHIAQIPSMEVLRGKFVNIINSPLQGFASVLNQIAEKKSA